MSLGDWTFEVVRRHYEGGLWKGIRAGWMKFVDNICFKQRKGGRSNSGMMSSMGAGAKGFVSYLYLIIDSKGFVS